MKNSIYFLLAILFFLSSCESKFDNPLSEVDKTLAQSQPAQPGFSNVRLFTIDRSLSPTKEKHLMKMSIDYDAQFDQMGVFLFLHDQFKKTKTFKELATIDLSNEKDADSKYVGRKILSLTQNKFSHHVDSVLVKLRTHDINGLIVPQTIATFILKKPNSYPFGIQHYEKNNIPQQEWIRLYSFDERKGTSYEQTGYHGKLVLVNYDSSKKEELLYQLDWNLHAVLANHSDKLTLPNQVVGSKDYHGQDSDFQGFAFGEDGE